LILFFKGAIICLDNRSQTRLIEVVAKTLGDIQASNQSAEAKNDNDWFVDATDLYSKDK